jgi:hypothetical protein
MNQKKGSMESLVTSNNSNNSFEIRLNVTIVTNITNVTNVTMYMYMGGLK